jgi:hypothetical protein
MPDPLLLRPRTALVVCLAAVALAAVVAAGGAQALTVAIVLWALCVVCAVRSVLRRRRRVAALYATGAVPLTLGLALLAWLAVHG